MCYLISKNHIDDVVSSEKNSRHSKTRTPHAVRAIAVAVQVNRARARRAKSPACILACVYTIIIIIQPLGSERPVRVLPSLRTHSYRARRPGTRFSFRTVFAHFRRFGLSAVRIAHAERNLSSALFRRIRQLLIDNLNTQPRPN